MLSQPVVNTTLRLLALPLALLATACGSQVSGGGSVAGSGGGDGSGGGAQTGVTSTGTQGGSGGSSSGSLAVAMTRAQLDVLWEEYWADNGEPGTSVAASGGGDLDPNDLFLHVSDLGASCDSPTVELTCGGHWLLGIAIPPALQQVGTYDLEGELSLYSHRTETGPPSSDDPGDCPWGGGSVGPGTVTILAIDADEVTFQLETEPVLWAEDPSGSYSAPRCP